MASSNPQLDAFIKHITGRLCDTLIECSDNDNQRKEIKLKQFEIKKLHENLGMGGTVLTAFAKHVLPHRDEIFNENESFFLDEMDYSTIHSKKFDISSDDAVELSGYMKNVWKTLAAPQKKKLWICFKVACNLADKAIEVKLRNEA